MSTVASNMTPRGRTCALIGGGVALVTLLTVRFVAGSPWVVLHRFSAGTVLPPLWLLGLVWFALPILCGWEAGLLFSKISHAAEREAAFWRGCTALVLSLMCASAWYVLLFGKCSLFFSGLCLPGAAILSLFGCVSWKDLSRGAVIVTTLHALWYLLLLILQLAVALHA